MIFNKTKRQSFMPESTKMKLDTSALASTSKDAETTRKALTSRDHASTAFSSASTRRALVAERVFIACTNLGGAGRGHYTHALQKSKTQIPRLHMLQYYVQYPDQSWLDHAGWP